MVDLVLALLAIIGLWLLVRALRRAQRGAPARTAPPETVEKARKAAEALALRGAIFEVTGEDTIPGHTLRELGQVHCEHRNRNAAEAILKRRAAETHPEANVLIRFSGREYQQSFRAGTAPDGTPEYRTRTRTGWTATACHAEPAIRAERLRAAWDTTRAIVDGSNVAFWEHGDKTPALAPVRAVVECLQSEGVEPLVVFDASIGHRTIGRNLKKADLRHALGRVRCEIVPAGTVADRRIIELAHERAAVIVTNDLFRDHPDARPIPKRRGFCVGGVAELLPPRA